MTNASTAFITISSTHEGESPARQLARMRSATMQLAMPDDRTVGRKLGTRTHRLPIVRSTSMVFGLLVAPVGRSRDKARSSIATLFCRHPRNETIRRGLRRTRGNLVGHQNAAMQLGRVATPA